MESMQLFAIHRNLVREGGGGGAEGSLAPTEFLGSEQIKRNRQSITFIDIEDNFRDLTFHMVETHIEKI